jgi:hypothetical protein
MKGPLLASKSRWTNCEQQQEEKKKASQKKTTIEPTEKDLNDATNSQLFLVEPLLLKQKAKVSAFGRVDSVD